MRSDFKSAAELPAGFWRWPHINPVKEWACRGSGQIVVDTEFLDQFERLRAMFDRPLIISSGYRSPAYNNAKSETGFDGPHTTGRAMDVLIYGAHAYELLGLVMGLGFYTGIGIHQRGDHAKRFLHLDALAAPEHPRPTIWTY